MLNKAIQHGVVKWNSTSIAAIMASSTSSTSTTDSSRNECDESECSAVSSSCWKGSEGWVHAEIQTYLETVLAATEPGIEVELEAELMQAKQLEQSDTSTDISSSTSTSQPSSASIWGGVSWMKKMEEVALDVANRADALASERGYNTLKATSLLRQKSSSKSQGLVSCLAPAFGVDFLNEWIHTDNHKIWYEQERRRIEMKLKVKNVADGAEEVGVGDIEDDDPPMINQYTDSDVTSSDVKSGGYLLSMMGSAATSLLFTRDAISDCPSSGLASFTYPNGDRYNGEWMNGQRHGRGVCLYAVSGDKHDGEWCSDVPHGEGSFTTGIVTLSPPPISTSLYPFPLLYMFAFLWAHIPKNMRVFF